jgi:glycolate oxidase FAD binding subunit
VSDATADFRAVILDAAAGKAALRIRGGGTKDFYGGELRGKVLDTREHSGIVDYEPTELALTARAGTRLSEIESALHANGQMLAFEPPRFGTEATLGGAIAAGLSGPRRPHAGSARDHVLGVRVIDGKGTELKFGGQVMKNVAGYDVSRLMVGALGTLGLLLDVSLKVLPRPPVEVTLRQTHPEATALDLMNAWAGKPYPITATCYADGQLSLRLSGAESAVHAARAKLGGELVPDADRYWNALRDHQADFFRTAAPLWRVSIKSTTPRLALGTPVLIEWGGALRWVAGELDARALRSAAASAGGHATLFRGGDKSSGVFHPLSPPISKLHQRLKDTFDPQGILNPGRLYTDL